MGRPVAHHQASRDEGQDRSTRILVDQFLQDDSIAERFAQYYLLFTKYRSDYQISAILAGSAPDEISERARAARFDERLALARLILDALDAHTGAVVETEQVVRVVRDAIREEKPAILSGENAQDALEGTSCALMQRAALDEKAGAPAKKLRPYRLGATWLSEFAGACGGERALSGETAFSVIERAYSARVREMKERSEACAREIECAFGFVEGTFGNGREMVAFTAEFAAREGTSQFTSRFGSDAYTEHGKDVLAASGQSDLEKRLQAIDLDALATADEEARKAEHPRNRAVRKLQRADASERGRGAIHNARRLGKTRARARGKKERRAFFAGRVSSRKELWATKLFGGGCLLLLRSGDNRLHALDSEHDRQHEQQHGENRL